VRRVVAILGTLCLLQLALTACGDDDGEKKNTGAVTVSGAFGTEPTVTFDGQVNRVDTDYETLVEGTGPEIAIDDTVFIHLYIANGYTQEKASSTYDDKAGVPIKVTKDTFTAFRDSIVGHTVGSRVEALATPKDAYAGQGNADSGIGNEDSVVLVVDILDKVREAPEGTDKTAPSRMPTLEEDGDKVTALDFSKAGSPTGDLEVITLVQGTGRAIQKGSPVALRYLGQVWDGKKPFDDNYDAEFPGISDSSGQAAPVVIGKGNVIKGWDRGLVGVKAGSRVLLEIPARLGYGKKGSGKLIKGGDTLVFVVDVLGVG
jgi:peptidylprolyl isomerase